MFEQIIVGVVVAVVASAAVAVWALLFESGRKFWADLGTCNAGAIPNRVEGIRIVACLTAGAAILALASLVMTFFHTPQIILGQDAGETRSGTDLDVKSRCPPGTKAIGGFCNIIQNAGPAVLKRFGAVKIERDGDGFRCGWASVNSNTVAQSVAQCIRAAD
jgi:hypothetical protein